MVEVRNRQHPAQRLPKYRNLMFDKRVCHGLTTKLIEQIDLRETKGSDTLSRTEKGRKGRSTKTLTVDSGMNADGLLMMTPRAKEGYEDKSCLTDEYVEDLSNFFTTQNQSSQTDSLLSRAIKGQNLITPKGESVGTQIERQDYLIDFNDQVQSVVRVLLNKVLEESRMEVLEELEMEKISQQKSHAHQDKMRALNKLQRAQFKDERLKDELNKRQIQSDLSKKGNEAAYKKLCVRGITKRLMERVQIQTAENVADTRDYLEIASARIYTDFLPLLYQGVEDALEERELLKASAQRLADETKTFLTRFHLLNVPKSE